jgi:cytochrome c oxidase subunit 1
MSGALSIDVHIHDTYFIVGHFHYVMFGGMGMAFFAALHHWFPKIIGRMYHKKPANLAWLLVLIGFNMMYFPMLILGWQGMPRRYYDYLPEYQGLNVLSTVGSWILVAGVLIMLANLVRSLRTGEKAGRDPWGGTTLEWTVPSPPPLLNFEEIPHVDHGPYEFERVIDK